MKIRSIPPKSRFDKQIEHIMTELEMHNPLSNTDQSVLAEYVEELEEALGECIKVANRWGWNGTDNSKILHIFFENSLRELTAYEVAAQVAEDEDVPLEEL